ncbi:DUF4815 domain-containing protein [Salmonella enterica]|nr:DUF4815 domain-containing protein [Salmonella enterica]
MPKTVPELTAEGNYYDRTVTDPKYLEKNYDKHLFIAGRILQSAEMNEIQSMQQTQLKGVADALFKDGDIVRDCRAIINTGVATLESGAIYLRGQVRGVPKGSLAIPSIGTVIIGIWLVSDVMTDTDDKTLLDPASGNRGFNEAGAYRLRLVPQWGLATDAIPEAEFFPVYYADDGQLRAKEPPPNLDAVTQAIARYDVDSNGSNYIISGMRVSRLADEGVAGQGGKQVFSVDSGRARVNGFGIAQNSARRVLFPIDLPLNPVTDEGLGAKTVNGKQRINVTYTPLHMVTSLLVQRTATIPMIRTRGSDIDRFLSTNDVAVVVKVSNAAKTFIEGTDYLFAQNVKTLSWLTGGDAPTPGSDYSVDAYQWEADTPLNQDDKGFEVTNAVESTAANPFTVKLDYSFRIPRIDRLVVNEDGLYTWIKGIASEINPVAPPVPNNVLSIAQVYQAWSDILTETYVINDGVRMVSMSTLEAMNSRLDSITDMIAQVNLVSDINVRDAGIKKGLFVDPFTNNNQRDQVSPGELAITGNCLQLPITATALTPEPASGATGVIDIESCDYSEELILSNTARTSDMKVNPYMAFDPPFPGSAIITPQVDRWVDTVTTWAAPETRYFVTTVYAPWTTQWGMHMTGNYTTGQNTVNELASSATADSEFLRQIEVKFTVTGFLANEEVVATFDGIPVTLTP